MELAGLPDAEIAARIQLTPAGLATMKATPEYRDLRDQIREGLVADLDHELGEDIKSLKDKVKAHVPAALQVLINAALQQKDAKLAYTAAKDIIELDGRLIEPQKLEVTTRMSKEDEAAVNEIIAAQTAVSQAIQ
jgi:hypothetical protein